LRGVLASRRQKKRDFSLREPTLSQERKGRKSVGSPKMQGNLLLRRVQGARGGLCGEDRETKVDISRVEKFKGLKVQRFRSSRVCKYFYVRIRIGGAVIRGNG
jgi:hypothetical protein